MLQHLACFAWLASLPLAHGQFLPTNQSQINATLDMVSEQYRTIHRSAIMHWPEEQNLTYESITFPAEDGIPLEAWYFPSNGSNKILYMNHPRQFTRGGLPGHLEPFNSSLAARRNNFDVNFIPDYKILVDAGYNVLVHDLRNHGHSQAAHGGMCTEGRYESRDVIGALRYIRTWEKTSNMTIGLYPRCMGGNAVLHAIHRKPEEFEGVRVLVVPQPISANTSIQAMMARQNVSTSFYPLLNQRIFETLSFHLEDFSPVPWARSVMMPTIMWQVRNDPTTTPADVQAIFDAVPVPEKRLFWIDNTTRRYDGYLHFQQHPSEILAFLDQYMN